MNDYQQFDTRSQGHVWDGIQNLSVSLSCWPKGLSCLGRQCAESLDVWVCGGDVEAGTHRKATATVSAVQLENEAAWDDHRFCSPILPILFPSFIALSALRMSQGISVLPSKSLVTDQPCFHDQELFGPPMSGEYDSYLRRKRRRQRVSCAGTSGTIFAAQMLVLLDKNRSWREQYSA